MIAICADRILEDEFVGAQDAHANPSKEVVAGAIMVDSTVFIVNRAIEFHASCAGQQ
jgi:hypothetical protein